jgi:hypothetical protein
VSDGVGVIVEVRVEVAVGLDVVDGVIADVGLGMAVGYLREAT